MGNRIKIKNTSCVVLYIDCHALTDLIFEEMWLRYREMQLQSQNIPQLPFPTNAQRRDNSMGACLAALQALLPFVASSKGQGDGGVFGMPIPTVDDKAVRNCAVSATTRALVRLSKILDDESAWSGADSRKIRDMWLHTTRMACDATGFQMLPRVRHNPQLVREGEVWCARAGEGQSLIEGRGSCPESALMDFDNKFSGLAT